MALCPLLPLLFCACSSDTPEPEPTPQPVAAYEVMVVFEPGQLGDRSMNDRLLADVQAFGSEHADSVTTSFISYDSYAETRLALSDWASMAYGAAPRQHRLLVLASPALTRLLPDVPLAATDRVLMLRTPLADARAVGPEGRTHVMNVSLASIINQFIDREMAYYDTLVATCQAQTVTDGPFRIVRYNENVAYADSIVETFQKRFPDQPLSDDGSQGIFLTGLTDGTDGSLQFSQEMAYTIGSMFDMQAAYDEDEGELHKQMAVMDLCMGNFGLEYYYFTHPESESRNLLVGEVLNIDSRLDYAIVRFPLTQWLNGWLSAPADLPQEEWHGSWDGCATYSPADKRQTPITDHRQ